MGKVQDTGKGTLQIIYGGLESPIMGIDQTKISDVFINPQALAEASGYFAQSGYLSTAFLNARAQLEFIDGAANANCAYVVGDVQVSVAVTGTPNTVNKSSYAFIAVSYPTQLTIYEYRNGLGGAPATISVSALQTSTLTYYVVNGVVYITGLGFGAIYEYTPGINLASTLAQLTDYVGGAFLGELNGRLLCLCCDAIVGGVYQYSPFQVSWSAAAGAYGQWNPLVGGLVTGAGFNNLPDVADEITGFFSVGPTGYVIRKQGITEMSPLNSGIKPFDFNHMWASNKGIGSVYSNTVKQYGSLGGFLSDTGVYTLGYGGVNTVQGAFWGQIVQQIQLYFKNLALSYTQALNAVSGAIVPITIAQETNLSYVLFIPGTTLATSTIFVGNILTQDWNILPFLEYVTELAGVVKIAALSYAAVYDSGTDQTIAIVSAMQQNGTLILFSIDDTKVYGNALQPDIESAPNCDFPIEEVSMFKDITVNAIGFYCDGAVVPTDNVEISPFVNETQYSTIVLNQLNQFVVSYPQAQPFTGKYLQLSLNTLMGTVGDSAARIYKIVMFCSYDPSQVP